MTKEQLAVLLERVETWPEEAQEELLRSANEIARRHDPVYELSDEEHADILEGLAEIERGEVMTEEEVREMFRQLRGE
jgi:predicted transcriptional regulator